MQRNELSATGTAPASGGGKDVVQNLVAYLDDMSCEKAQGVELVEVKHLTCGIGKCGCGGGACRQRNDGGRQR
jgi:hypothetical protein